jgi:hypothetical protein
MRAAQLDKDNVVINFAEVGGFDGGFTDPLDAVIGSLWNGSAFTHPPVKMPTVAEYTAAIQAMLDTKAREHHYDDIVSACSYAAAPNPFQSEGISFVSWRGACWALCYSLMAEVQAGTRPQPTIAQLVATMPVFAA